MKITARGINKCLSLVAAGVLIVSFQNCNKVSFSGSDNLASQAPGGGGAVGGAGISKVLSPAVITGVMGGSDAIPDNVLTDLSSPSVVWQMAEGAVSYKISIYDSSNTSVVCAEQVVQDSSISYDKNSGCNLVNGSQYIIHLGSYDDVGNGVDSVPYAFSVNFSAVPPTPLPPAQKVASCQSINVIEINTVMPIQTVVVPQMQPDANGNYASIPYAGDSATVTRLCQDLGCGDYVTSTGRGYTSPGNNSVVRYNTVSTFYEIYPAKFLNNKIQTLSCTPFDTVKITSSCNGGFCDTGKLVTRNGNTVTVDSAAELKNANKICQAAGYPSAYGLWYDGASSTYWAQNRATYSWNSTTNKWDLQPVCYECLVSKEVICKKH